MQYCDTCIHAILAQALAWAKISSKFPPSHTIKERMKDNACGEHNQVNELLIKVTT